MKIMDLSKELGISNKDLITFFRDNGYKVSSHMQRVDEEMESLARDHFSHNSSVVEEPVIEKVKPAVKEEVREVKIFNSDDKIPCRSVTPWSITTVGLDGRIVYHWENWGDIEYVRYSDLSSFRRKDLIMKPMVIIEDADLCYNWRRELGNTYSTFLNVEYPEEFFDVSDEEFKKYLNGVNTPNVIKEVIKVTCINMIKNENYPSLNKIRLIDDILGTCIAELIK